MAQGIAGDGFEAGSKWIEAANLTPQEFTSIVSNLNYGLLNSKNGADTGRWIEWAAANLPAGESDKIIRNLVGSWTGHDFQAVGDWLNATPDSPTKTTSIGAYAEMLARSEPAAATQWAMTLPPGSERDAALKRIQESRPHGTPP